MNLSFSSQKSEVNLFGVVYGITGDEWILKHDNISVELEAIWTQLCVAFIDDILGEKQDSEVHSVLFDVIYNLNLLDRFWGKLEHESLGNW